MAYSCTHFAPRLKTNHHFFVKRKSGCPRLLLEFKVHYGKDLPAVFLREPIDGQQSENANTNIPCSLFPVFPTPLRAVHYFFKEQTPMAYPTNYKYTREHEWISLSGSIGSIGITDYAQNSLGDIVYVDVPKVGDPVTAHATFGSVESVKAVSDLYSPVTGTVTATNEELKSSPDKINEDPHGAWIIKVQLADLSQFDALLDAAAYEAFISEETGA
jgi:glycine cleavage system H protein